MRQIFNPTPDVKLWRKSARHLPKQLRDFHQQKELFKAIELAYGQAKFPGGQTLSWTSAHIYALDHFLWFLAAHGYTLQKARAGIAFSELSDTLAAAREEASRHSPLSSGDGRQEQGPSIDFSDAWDALHSHLLWCPQVWSSQPGEKTSDLRSLSIAVLGLIGEAGEFVDSLEKPDRIDQLKEAGDTLYYWCVLCDAFSLDAKSLSQAGLGLLSSDSSRGSSSQEVRLLKATAALSEVFKKFVRDLGSAKPDSKDHPFWAKLNNAMFEIFTAYCALLSSNVLDIRSVCEANKAKLLDRRARGVTRGDGDNR